MPNEQTSVPLFTSGEVLTAANMNISAGTGVPVFTNTTTRDAAFGGAGEKVLAEGQLCYLSSTNVVQYYDGAAWQPVGASAGMTLVSATTIGSAVGSVTVSSAFSATYDAYKIIVTGGALSTNERLTLTLGSTSTGYYASYFRTTSFSDASYDGQILNNGSGWVESGYGTSSGLGMNIELQSPFLAKTTILGGVYQRGNTTVVGNGTISGMLNDTTSYTAFTITPVAGTMTGGTVRVYGYLNS
jgi:hypothetical protein